MLRFTHLAHGSVGSETRLSNLKDSFFYILLLMDTVGVRCGVNVCLHSNFQGSFQIASLGWRKGLEGRRNSPLLQEMAQPLQVFWKELVHCIGKMVRSFLPAWGWAWFWGTGMGDMSSAERVKAMPNLR